MRYNHPIHADAIARVAGFRAGDRGTLERNMDVLLVWLGPLIYLVPYASCVMAAVVVLWILKRHGVFSVIRGTYASAVIAALAFSPAVVPMGHYPMIYPYVVSPVVQFGQWDWLLINSGVALLVFFAVLIYKLRSNRRIQTDAHAESARG